MESALPGFYYYVKPELPDVATLRDVELQTPMQVFSQDGKLISQFAEKRRNPVTYDEIPRHLVEALIATEDSRFYEHPGIDPIGIGFRSDRGCDVRICKTRCEYHYSATSA